MCNSIRVKIRIPVDGIPQMNIFDRLTKIVFAVFVFFFISSCDQEPEPPQSSSRTDIIYRGFDTSMYKTDAQMDSALAITGANIFRTIDPFVSKEPPYDFIEDAFENLDRFLDW